MAGLELTIRSSSTRCGPCSYLGRSIRDDWHFKPTEVVPLPMGDENKGEEAGQLVTTYLGKP